MLGFAPVLSEVTKLFWSAEYCALMVVGLTAVAAFEAGDSRFLVPACEIAECGVWPLWVTTGLGGPRPVASAVRGRDAMRPKDAASYSFDCFTVDEKERDAMTWSAAVVVLRPWDG